MSEKFAEVFHPGVFIRDELEERGWTQADLAEIVGRSTRQVSDVLRGKGSVTPEMACVLAGAFGTSAEIWVNLQSAYDLNRARITFRHRD